MLAECNQSLKIVLDFSIKLLLLAIESLKLTIEGEGGILLCRPSGEPPQVLMLGVEGVEKSDECRPYPPEEYLKKLPTRKCRPFDDVFSYSFAK